MDLAVFLLFIMTIIISFIIVRIGGIAFEFTGMQWEQAKFQSLSCFTGTGFTTREAELITGHPQRRKIATILMVLGHAGFVTLIATFATYLGQNYSRTKSGLVIVPWLDLKIPLIVIQISKIAILSLALFIIYKFFIKSFIWTRLVSLLKHRMKRMGIITPVTFEELIVGAKGYGIIKIKISPESELCGKSLFESGLRSKYEVQVLAIERGDEVFPNPRSEDRIVSGDELLCFGRRDMINENLKRVCC